MGYRGNDYAVWAILGHDDVPVLCTRKEANKWFWSKDYRRSQIKDDHVDRWCIYTSFSRLSNELDGPPMFWRAGCFAETGPYMGIARHFSTKEATLEFHATLAAMLRAHGDDALKLSELVDQVNDEDPDEADWWKE